MTGYALTHPDRLDLETFARAVGVHPEFARRLVALGVLDADVDPVGRLWFRADQLVAAARVQRLRAAFGLNYAAVGLVTDLLDRITRLERTVRTRRGPTR